MAKKVTKQDQKNYLTAILVLVIAFALLIMIGASLTYTPAELGAEAGSLQKFVEWCIAVKDWFSVWYVWVGIGAIGLFAIYKIRK